MMTKEAMERIKEAVRVVPDFPKPGIQFIDITSVWKDPELLDTLVEDAAEFYKDRRINKIVGIESRGFVLGAALAVRMGAGFVPVRKKGKTPDRSNIIQEDYAKEYGVDTLEMNGNDLTKDDVVLIQDDILATGGTMKAVIDMCNRAGVKRIYVNCTVELTYLNGRDELLKLKCNGIYCPIRIENPDPELDKTDLMAGDWVADENGQPCIIGPIRVRSGCKYYGIPLTDDHISQMGFKYDRQDEAYMCLETSEDGTLSIGKLDNGFYKLEYSSRLSYFIKYIKYVHELQELLKIFGMGKMARRFVPNEKNNGVEWKGYGEHEE